jgi:hypothetical protein
MTIGAYFVFEMIAALAMSGRSFGLPGILSPATVLVPLTLPLPLAAYAFRLLNPRPGNMAVASEGPWLAIWVAAAIGILGIAAFMLGAMLGNPREKDPAYRAEKEIQWYRTITALGDIEPVLRFMDPETSAEVHALAVADLSKRPHLTAELADVFANGGVSTGANAARYLKEMKPAPPPELAEPYRKFADRTLELIRRAEDGPYLKTYAGHAAAVLIGAQALGTHEVDAQIREMRASLARFPRQTADATAFIDRFVTQP